MYPRFAGSLTMNDFGPDLRMSCTTHQCHSWYVVISPDCSFAEKVSTGVRRGGYDEKETRMAMSIKGSFCAGSAQQLEPPHARDTFRLTEQFHPIHS